MWLFVRLLSILGRCHTLEYLISTIGLDGLGEKEKEYGEREGGRVREEWREREHRDEGEDKCDQNTWYESLKELIKILLKNKSKWKSGEFEKT